MAKTMKAAVVHKFGDPLVIEDVPIPSPGPGQILIKVAASGVCHTDLHAVDGDWPVKPKLPLIPGHEGVGPVAALGAGVTDIKEGDLVGVPWLHDACGKCEFCVTGWETVCEKGRYTGYFVDGGYAEYVLGNANYVGHLPAGTDLVTMAPILCAALRSIRASSRPRRSPASGWSSPASAASAILRCNMPRQWASLSARSTSTKRSSRWPGRSAPTSRPTRRPKTPLPKW